MSKPSISQMEKQIEELQLQIAIRKEELKNEAKLKVEQVLREYGFSLEDIFPAASRSSAKNDEAASKVMVKFRHGEQTWSGRGKVPLWIQAILKEREISLAEFKTLKEFSADAE